LTLRKSQFINTGFFPVGRFPELQKEFNAARNNNQLGSNQVYRDQIASLNLRLPADLPNANNLEDVAEEETRKILKGTPDDALLKSLQRKLRQFRAVSSKSQFPILKRNLSVLIRV
jgi:hypothetical protein